MLRWVSVQQGHRAGESVGGEQMIPLLRKRHEHGVLFVVASEDDLDPRIDPEMAADGQQAYVTRGYRLLIFEEIPQLLGEVLVREQAATCGGGVAADSVPFRELQLDGARPAVDTEELFPVDEPVLFGLGGWQERCGQGADDQALHIGVALDNVEGIP